jgi:alkylhydroperoxidase/carboxymuconolactone decarboxylase family protein YurZ
MTPNEPNALKRVNEMLAQHPDDAELILLGALSVCWLQPQDPQAAELLQEWQRRGLSLAALREAALQLFLVAGFQVSLEAFFQIEATLDIHLEAESETITQGAAVHWLERGRALQEEVYRRNTEKLRANLATLSPELAEWTVLVGYGLVLSRPGLEPGIRELLEVAVLVAQGFPRQLHSHLRGALNLGMSEEKVDLLLDVVETFLPDERMLSARQLWSEIRAKNLPN